MTESMGTSGTAAARWERPPVEHYQLGAAVHVWRVNVRQSPLPLREAAELLSDQEHIRARRFRQTADRDRYMSAHGALRTILGRYLNESPAQIRFQQTTQGKPSLAPEFQASRLRFNLAHSGDWALVAVAAGREVGVDVEQFRPLLEAAPIAKRYFAPDELAALEALTDAERPAAFFHIWTSKEAFIKATGLGLSAPLQSFSVPLLPAARPALIQTGAAQAWGLRRLALGAGYAGAVVTEGLDWDVALWQF
jgi:4'-phosphopantetheinyl transferase